MFKRLFPEDFDRALPVIDHSEVDRLLHLQDKWLAAYEQVRGALLGLGLRARRSRPLGGRARGQG